jgi:hypothetical protein
MSTIATGNRVSPLINKSNQRRKKQPEPVTPLSSKGTASMVMSTGAS